MSTEEERLAAQQAAEDDRKGEAAAAEAERVKDLQKERNTRLASLPPEEAQRIKEAVTAAAEREQAEAENLAALQAAEAKRQGQAAAEEAERLAAHKAAIGAKEAAAAAGGGAGGAGGAETAAEEGPTSLEAARGGAAAVGKQSATLSAEKGGGSAIVEKIKSLVEKKPPTESTLFGSTTKTTNKAFTEEALFEQLTPKEGEGVTELTDPEKKLIINGLVANMVIQEVADTDGATLYTNARNEPIDHDAVRFAALRGGQTPDEVKARKSVLDNVETLNQPKAEEITQKTYMEGGLVAKGKQGVKNKMKSIKTAAADIVGLHQRAIDGGVREIIDNAAAIGTSEAKSLAAAALHTAKGKTRQETKRRGSMGAGAGAALAAGTALVVGTAGVAPAAAGALGVAANPGAAVLGAAAGKVAGTTVGAAVVRGAHRASRLVGEGGKKAIRRMSQFVEGQVEGVADEAVDKQVAGNFHDKKLNLAKNFVALAKLQKYEEAPVGAAAAGGGAAAAPAPEPSAETNIKKRFTEALQEFIDTIPASKKTDEEKSALQGQLEELKTQEVNIQPGQLAAVIKTAGNINDQMVEDSKGLAGQIKGFLGVQRGDLTQYFENAFAPGGAAAQQLAAAAEQGGGAAAGQGGAPAPADAAAVAAERAAAERAAEQGGGAGADPAVAAAAEARQGGGAGAAEERGTRRRRSVLDASDMIRAAAAADAAVEVERAAAAAPSPPPPAPPAGDEAAKAAAVAREAAETKDRLQAAGAAEELIVSLINAAGAKSATTEGERLKEAGVTGGKAASAPTPPAGAGVGKAVQGEGVGK
jgi:trimeric autotransporter adhesin